MKRLTLKRRWYDADRTLGVLTYGKDFAAFTMEPGRWDLHATRAPTGFYLLERHGWEPDSTLKFKRTWALVGRDVSHQAEEGVQRSAILIHAGNLDEETKGCIMLGTHIGWMSKEPALMESRLAIQSLRSFLGEADALLVIEG